jgi:L,D-peptidoglycan transpeptidase YkuD (ErfK/YbiS/YcfS/YnhG family)
VGVRPVVVAALTFALVGSGLACAPAGSSATPVPSATRATSDNGAAAPTAASRHMSTDARLPRHLVGVHHARQVVTVISSGYGTIHATVRGFRKRPDGWHRSFGPWPALIGWNGFAPRGDKREGDGRTPTGSFRLPFAFGVDPDPGTRLPYRRALSTSRWDDDPSSTNYNRWVDIRYGDPGTDPEHMRVLPDYRYGVVIGYNLDRTPGQGSAIFFHVADGTSTAGCVSVSRHRVVRALRWLRPHLHPRFIMGTKSAVTR